MTDWLDGLGEAFERAPIREKGNYFEAFDEGDVLEHDPGLRLTREGNELWMSQTLNHDPAYWRPDAARKRGFDEPPVHPDFLLAATMGPSVEDLSEKGGYFLGRTDVEFHRDPVPTGTDLRVTSTVKDTRTSSSRPAYGIVTWETRSVDAETGETLCSYERTNMLPRREPAATDGGTSTGETDDDGPDLPENLIAPDGPYFEDFRAALDRAADGDTAVAYRHERGRTIDDAMMSVLPLRTLNTARQHHNVDAMADSPSGDVVTYGDVTRSIALGHARSDEATYRERRYEDERFHDFVALDDTVYAFTRVRAAEAVDDRTGRVTFTHYAVNQHGDPVYSGTRTADIRRRTE